MGNKNKVMPKTKTIKKKGWVVVNRKGDIFLHEYKQHDAKIWANASNRYAVPCEITYKLPVTKKK